MEILTNRKAYPSEMAVKIEQLSTIAVSIANRWMLGWPERVVALLKAGTYLEALEAQTDQEKDVLAEAGHLNHLARHEILRMYEIREAPPQTAPVVTSDPDILGGTPVFTGTRVPIATLFENLAGGLSLDEILDSYPTIRREQAIEALHQAELLLELVRNPDRLH